MTLQEIRAQLGRANLEEVAKISGVGQRTLYRVRDNAEARVLQETFDKLHAWAATFRDYKRIPTHLRRRTVGHQHKL
ncbi:MAG: hypothetical protein EON55_09250 [Alphaproteobacteria bacterium]|nr:MAG: hypothetical protein EON55_09250 [Alphaproteobacteria bacterium]